MGNKLLELLFPPKCMLCGGLTGEAGRLCPACLEKLSLREAPPRLGSAEGLDLAAAGLWYEDSVRRALHGLKYQEKQSYARPLARVMADTYRTRMNEQADLVTWVPTNRSTRRSRGYDQARLLAEEVSKLLSLPCAETLEKTRETQAMHGLDPAARRANVAGAYRLCCPSAAVAGKRVLLVDDILTTGASLSACALALKQAGALRVAGLCAASPRGPGEKSAPAGENFRKT